MVDVARTPRAQRIASVASPSGEASFGRYAQAAIERLKRLARDEPVSFGLWAFGIGFLVAWRIKP